VHALADRLTSIAPDITVTAVDGLVRPGELLEVDAVLLATDDPWCEVQVNRTLYPAGIPMISAKLFARAEAGEIIIVDPSSATPCLRCLTASRSQSLTHDVDYGTGKLRAELALGPDIAAITHRAVKMLLALIEHRRGHGPLASWIGPMLDARRTLYLSGNIDAWGIFGELDMGPLDGPFASLWVRTQSSPECPVCSPEPADRDHPTPVLVSIGVTDDGVA
jgi:molybdopterin/thiamine biosynthesis adenylyltransferase